MEDLPPEVLRQVFTCLPASSDAAAAVAHPALAAVAKTLPELSDVRLRLALPGARAPSKKKKSGEEAPSGGAFAELEAYEASVRDFFTRPGASAPHVHSLHIEAVLGPGLDRADPPLPTKSWRRPPVRVQIWQRPPSLDWLTPVLRSVRSLRLTFAPEFKRDAYGQVSERAPLQARTISALLSRSDALEMLHIDLGRIMLSTLDITEWRNVLPMNDLHALPVCALPASVKQLTLESAGLLRLPYRPMTVPEIRSLERLVLRASEVFVASLDAFQRHSPQHLTLQAGSKITVPFEAAGAVVGAARQLVAKGCQIEFCGPSPDCIEVSMRNATEVPSRQQVDELVEQLRSWFVETVQTDAD